MGPLIYAFGSFELDLDRFELRSDGSPLALEPRAFDLLRLLIEQRGGVVTKAEILARVWRHEHVCEGSIHRAVNQLRGVLGQRLRRGGPIETVHRRGYRFASAVHLASGSDQEIVLRGDASSPAPARSGAEGPFVGRDDVMERLRSMLAVTRSGQPQLCVLTGETGIGRTRCTREFERFARSQGASVWRVSCAAGASEPPLWPWLEVLRLCADEEQRSAAFVIELRSVLAEIAKSLAQPEMTTPETPEFPLLDRIARTVVRACKWRVRVLVLDDLHHMQHAALRALGLIAATPSRSRLMVLATLRDDRPHAENLASATLGRLLRHAERIPLRPLTPSALAEYVIASKLPCSGELTGALHAKTRGNPLFVREMIHLLIARHGRDELATLRSDELAVPDAVREVVLERLGTLDGVGRRLLGFASAIGEHFEVPLLLEASGVSGPAALSALDQALSQSLIEQRKELGGYSFSHGLIVDTLYENLSAVERTQIHAAIAVALETRPQSPPQALALHFHHALPLSDPLKAMSYCRRAARLAAAKRAYDELPRLLSWALEAERFAPNPDAERHARWMFELARALYSVGDVLSGRRAVQDLIELSGSHRRGDLIGAAALLLRPTVEVAWREDPLLLRGLQEAQAHLGTGHEVLRLRLQSCMAAVPPLLWNPARSLEMVEGTLGEARKLGDLRCLFDVLSAKAYVQLTSESLQECLETIDEILALVAASGSSQAAVLTAVEAHRMRHIALFVLGKMPQAEVSLEFMREMSQRFPMPILRLGYERKVIAREIRLGLFESARRRLSATATEAERRGLGFARLLSWRAEVELARACRSAAGMEYLPPPADLVRVMPELQAIHARHLFEVGSHEEARRILVRLSADDFAALPRRVSMLASLSSLSLVAVGVGDRERQRSLYALLRRYESLFAVDILGFSLGSVHQYLGVLAAGLGHKACAERHFQTACAENLRTDDRVALVETEAAWAELKVSARRAR